MVPGKDNEQNDQNDCQRKRSSARILQLGYWLSQSPFPLQYQGCFIKPVEATSPRITYSCAAFPIFPINSLLTIGIYSFKILSFTMIGFPLQ